MTVWILALGPALAGGACFFVRNDQLRRSVLAVTALAHFALTAAEWVTRADPGSSTFALDGLGHYFLSVTSAIFLASAIYCVGFLARESGSSHHGLGKTVSLRNQPERYFTAFMLFFLSAMTFVAVSRHLGYIWIAMEATTLASAPLIYFHRHSRSLEAMWRYLLICSVGIALALFGVFSMAHAAAMAQHEGASLALSSLSANAGNMDKAWLKLSFIFMFVGFGTKMGLAPFHMWLPDAYAKAPAPVSALLSGALSNCAFLAILRSDGILIAAGLAPYTMKIFLVFGLLSMFASAVFIVGQRDFRRILAYSSVEHMGILAFGVGLGGAGAFGAALHTAVNPLVKAGLFMTAGNILARYGTKEVSAVKGAMIVVPVSGAIWIAGLFAVTGAPPFATFVSEFTIFKAAVEGGRPYLAALYLFLLAVIFIGMARSFISMVYGEPVKETKVGHEAWLSILPPMVLLGVALALGVYIPSAVLDAVNEVAKMMGGGL